MSKSEEKRKKLQQEKQQQPRPAFAWTERVHSVTHINKEDFYRIVAALHNLGEPLVRSPLKMIQERGEKICSLAYKMDLFFSEAAKTIGLEDKGLVLELKIRKWEAQPSVPESGDDEGDYMEENNLAVAR